MFFFHVAMRLPDQSKNYQVLYYQIVKKDQRGYQGWSLQLVFDLGNMSEARLMSFQKELEFFMERA